MPTLATNYTGSPGDPATFENTGFGGPFYPPGSVPTGPINGWSSDSEQPEIALVDGKLCIFAPVRGGTNNLNTANCQWMLPSGQVPKRARVELYSQWEVTLGNPNLFVNSSGGGGINGAFAVNGRRTTNMSGFQFVAEGGFSQDLPDAGNNIQVPRNTWYTIEVTTDGYPSDLVRRSVTISTATKTLYAASWTLPWPEVDNFPYQSPYGYTVYFSPITSSDLGYLHPSSFPAYTQDHVITYLGDCLIEYGPPSAPSISGDADAVHRAFLPRRRS